MKKPLILGIAIVLSISVFCGCSNGADSDKGSKKMKYLKEKDTSDESQLDTNTDKNKVINDDNKKATPEVKEKKLKDIEVVDEAKEEPKELEEKTDEGKANIKEETSDKEKNIEVIDEKNNQTDLTVESPDLTGKFNQDIASKLNKDLEPWWFRRNNEHKPVTAQEKIDIKKYNAYYLGQTQEKVIYLTFDNGYENGYTPQILDILKENDVKAAFFVTKSFIRDESELVKRMKEEGHIVGNHSVTHPSFPGITDEKVVYEIEETARFMKEKTGYDMDKYFRFPRGEYSEKTLYIASELGYKSIFWSMTYAKDWDLKKQDEPLVVLTHNIDNLHPGAITLTHAVSPSNAAMLDQFVKTVKEQGYRFVGLEELDELKQIEE